MVNMGGKSHTAGLNISEPLNPNAINTVREATKIVTSATPPLDRPEEMKYDKLRSCLEKYNFHNVVPVITDITCKASLFDGVLSSNS